jgi:hypothetical protein
LPVLLEEIEQPPDLIRPGDLSHRGRAVYPVMVPPPHAPALDDTGLNEVGDDPLNRTFCDPHRLAQVSEGDVAVLCDAQQHLTVVR